MLNVDPRQQPTACQRVSEGTLKQRCTLQAAGNTPAGVRAFLRGTKMQSQLQRAARQAGPSGRGRARCWRTRCAANAAVIRPHLPPSPRRAGVRAWGRFVFFFHTNSLMLGLVVASLLTRPPPPPLPGLCAPQFHPGHALRGPLQRGRAERTRHSQAPGTGRGMKPDQMETRWEAPPQEAEARTTAPHTTTLGRTCHLLVLPPAWCGMYAGRQAARHQQVWGTSHRASLRACCCCCFCSGSVLPVKPCTLWPRGV